MSRPFLLSTLSLCFLSIPLIAQTTPAPATPATAPHFSKDTPIYVSDFDLDAQNVQTDQSAVGHRRPGILESPRKKEEHDPQAQAKKIVDTMATTIVSDLQKAGYKAQRLPSDAAKPNSGAWVHGIFTQVDEGNRMQRAVIGFGAGDVKMQLYVTMTDLAKPDQQPLYQAASSETSGNKPGAVITMNPYVAAAKFVMEQNAPEKTVKKTAGDIAKQVEQHLSGQPAPAS
jgi:hypothetical protein